MNPKEVKSALNTHVKLKGSETDYLFSAYMLRKTKTGFIHQAELQDTRSGNSVRIVKLEDVEK